MKDGATCMRIVVNSQRVTSHKIIGCNDQSRTAFTKKAMLKNIFGVAPMNLSAFQGTYDLYTLICK